MSRLLLILFALTLSACATASPEREAPDSRPLVILVGVDGFRPDYLDRGVTPTLGGLRADGAFAAMRPSFPSVTFPNHYTLVTGLHPDRHGIVNNTMADVDLGRFSLGNAAAVTNGCSVQRRNSSSPAGPFSASPKARKWNGRKATSSSPETRCTRKAHHAG